MNIDRDKINVTTPQITQGAATNKIEAAEQSLPDYRQKGVPDGVPCKHPGCLHHVSHPCEGCGRIAGRSGDSTEEMRREFERWYMAEMCASEIFERWSDTDYYEDSDVQKTWRGWQAAIASKQEELEGLRAAAKFWQEKAGRMSEELVNTQRAFDNLLSINTALRETLAALEAKIAEADRKAAAEVDWFVCSELPDGRLQYTQDNSEEEYAMQLFTRPPITSQHELELLGIVEQMRKVLVNLTDICITQVGADYNGHVSLDSKLPEKLKMNHLGKVSVY